MEYIVPGDGFFAEDTDLRELIVPGDGFLAESTAPADAGGGGGRFAGRFAFRALGRNPYLRNTAQDFDAPPPPPPPVLGDAGAGPLVVPTWDGFRLARASRYYYQRPALDVPVVVQPDTWQPFTVRVPFKPFGRNRYLFNGSVSDQPPQPGTHATHLVRVPFKALGRNPYRFNRFGHDSFVAPQHPPHPPHPQHPRDRLEGRFKYMRAGVARYYLFRQSSDVGVIVGGFNPAWALNANVVINRVGTPTA